MLYSADTVDGGVRGYGCVDGGISIGLRWRREVMRRVFMGYGGLGLGAFKEGSGCSSPLRPTLALFSVWRLVLRT